MATDVMGHALLCLALYCVLVTTGQADSDNKSATICILCKKRKATQFKQRLIYYCYNNYHYYLLLLLSLSIL